VTNKVNDAIRINNAVKDAETKAANANTALTKSKATQTQANKDLQIALTEQKTHASKGAKDPAKLAADKKVTDAQLKAT